MTVSKPTKATAAVVSTLIGPSIPGGYMAITGHAPEWARAWYLVWLVVWALIVIGKAASS